ncbi:hypothetical protein KIPB_008164 [Kipferlia bialata]|uniref:Uncharacterized protein n=1 Tax=Kipferlia bialata TaxID=797122 RepID=A0A391NMY5_9EUKA|nr:hypothetical protein KIPB_008164 [Kipferlia bialata]|eukprot:g8164.t1
MSVAGHTPFDRGQGSETQLPTVGDAQRETGTPYPTDSETEIDSDVYKADSEAPTLPMVSNADPPDSLLSMFPVVESESGSERESSHVVGAREVGYLRQELRSALERERVCVKELVQLRHSLEESLERERVYRSSMAEMQSLYRALSAECAYKTEAMGHLEREVTSLREAQKEVKGDS